jgi:hypothetical protein
VVEREEPATDAERHAANANDETLNPGHMCRAIEVVKREEPATEAEREESVQALEQLKGRVPLMSKDDVQSAIDRLIQQVRSSGSLLR